MKNKLRALFERFRSMGFETVVAHAVMGLAAIIILSTILLFDLHQTLFQRAEDTGRGYVLSYTITVLFVFGATTLPAILIYHVPLYSTFFVMKGIYRDEKKLIAAWSRIFRVPNDSQEVYKVFFFIALRVGLYGSVLGLGIVAPMLLLLSRGLTG